MKFCVEHQFEYYSILRCLALNIYANVILHLSLNSLLVFNIHSLQKILKYLHQLFNHKYLVNQIQLMYVSIHHKNY